MSADFDPHAALRDKVLDTVMRGPGQTDPSVREAAAANSDVASELAALVDKIHQHAYRVTDDDMSRAQSIYGDDRLFEIVVSAALGASRRRLLAGLDALERA